MQAVVLQNGDVRAHNGHRPIAMNSGESSNFCNSTWGSVRWLRGSPALYTFIATEGVIVGKL